MGWVSIEMVHARRQPAVDPIGGSAGTRTLCGFFHITPNQRITPCLFFFGKEPEPKFASMGLCSSKPAPKAAGEEARALALQVASSGQVRGASSAAVYAPTARRLSRGVGVKAALAKLQELAAAVGAVKRGIGRFLRVLRLRR